MSDRAHFGPWTQPGIVLGLVIGTVGYFVTPVIWLAFFAALVGLNARKPRPAQVSCGVLLLFPILVVALLIYAA